MATTRGYGKKRSADEVAGSDDCVGNAPGDKIGHRHDCGNGTKAQERWQRGRPAEVPDEQRFARCSERTRRNNSDRRVDAREGFGSDHDERRIGRGAATLASDLVRER